MLSCGSVCKLSSPVTLIPLNIIAEYSNTTIIQEIQIGYLGLYPQPDESSFTLFGWSYANWQQLQSWTWVRKDRQPVQHFLCIVIFANFWIENSFFAVSPLCSRFCCFVHLMRCSWGFPGNCFNTWVQQ